MEDNKIIREAQCFHIKLLHLQKSKIIIYCSASKAQQLGL